MLAQAFYHNAKIAASFILLALILTVASLTSASAATSIPFTVAMSENVTVTGTPRIILDVDGNTRYATYTSGSGTSSLTFTYAATSGDVDLNGIGIASTTIDLNGGTLTDLNGNNASLTFVAPANMGSILVNYPSLSMDFIADADGRYTLSGTVYNDLTSFLTAAGGSFTRASTATYYDSAGTLQTAASGVPRFDYNPSTLALRGLLIEESRTNFVLDSADITTANYSNENMTLTGNVTTAPDGTATADKVIDNATNLRHIFLSKQAAIVSGTKYTGSMFVKAAEQQYVQLLFGTVNFGSNAYANFLLSGAGSVTYTGASASATSINSVGNGWYRISITATATATSTDFHIFAALLNNTNNTSRTPAYAGTGGGIYVWGVQDEIGAFATSYIPTTTATVTRAADILTIPTGAWYNQPAGTLYGFGESVSMNVDHRLATIRESSSNYYGLRITSSNLAQFIAYDAGGLKGITSAGTVSAGNVKMVGAQQLNDLAHSYNGGFLVTGSVWSPVTASYLAIGYDGVSLSSGFAFMNGYIKGIKYYPLRVSNAQMQLLTQ